MIRIYTILEEEGIKEFLLSRNIIERYKLAKDKLILSSRIRGLDFKIREPKKNKIYSFRISGKWRAYGYFKDDVFVVSKIDDHQ